MSAERTSGSDDRSPGGDRPPASVPRLEGLAGPFGCALTVDVEEWYHTCYIPELNDPRLRPAGLAEELDWLLPELLELLAEHGARATFFCLGEVAERLPARIREIAAAGHEVASHGYLHLRVGDRPPAEWRRDIERSRTILEQLTGRPVNAYRAPEWSLRTPENPCLQLLAELGFTTDSSLAPFLGAGRMTNRRTPYRLVWPGGGAIEELPPLTFAGPLRLPAGSWPGRLAGAGLVARAAVAHRRAGGMPVAVVHPWEVSGRPTPGRLGGWAGFIHETGRRGYRRRFGRLLAALPWSTLAEARHQPAGEAGEAVEEPFFERPPAAVRSP